MYICVIYYMYGTFYRVWLVAIGNDELKSSIKRSGESRFEHDKQ